MLPFTLLWLLTCPVFSESFVVPSLRARSISEAGWRKANITQSLPVLIDIASAALQKASDGANTVNQFDGQTYEFMATLYSEMAEFDMITNQTKYEDFLQQAFSKTQITRPNFSNTQTYGYAALRAYAAYQNSTFLDYAIQSWSFGQSYTLSQASTSLVGKNFTVQGTCDGATMAGGTFLTTTASDPSMAAMSTGYFLLLSALLAEATSNPTYLNAATESMNFIHSHLYNNNGLLLQAVSASANDSCKVLDDSVNSFNSGLFIEGLAVLASQTQDAPTQNLLNNLITDVLSNPTWQTAGGIIAIGDGKNGDSILVRALTTAYVRNVTTPDVRQNLRDYIAVQFNAVVDLATNGDNVYADQWTGPPSSSFSLNNQTSALSPLLSAAYLLASNNLTSTVSSTSPSSSAPTQSATSSKTPAATIAGATVGGLLVLAIVGVVYLIFRRRAQARQQLKAPAPMSTAQPFLSPTGYSIASASNASQPLNDPSFANPSDASFAPPTHPSIIPPTDFSFIPRSYAVAEKGRPQLRHVPQQPSTTFTSTSGGSGPSAYPATSHPDLGASLRDSRVPGEEPPPEYVASGR